MSHYTHSNSLFHDMVLRATFNKMYQPRLTKPIFWFLGKIYSFLEYFVGIPHLFLCLAQLQISMNEFSNPKHRIAKWTTQSHFHVLHCFVRQFILIQNRIFQYIKILQTSKLLLTLLSPGALASALKVVLKVSNSQKERLIE